MVLNCKITVGSFVFTAVNHVEINSSWKKFTDTAIIKIPRDIYYYQQGVLKKVSKPLQDLVKPNDYVKIELGHNTDLYTEFEGYVAMSPKATIPYEIVCEDEMFVLKQKQVNISIENATIRQILEQAAEGYSIECADENYGDFSMQNVTPLQVFEELKKRANLYTFFRGKTLVCGLIYSDQGISQNEANYKIGENVINNDLRFQKPEDVRLLITATSKQENGSVITESIGEAGGNIKKKTYNVSLSRDDLKKILNREYASHKSTGGYDGEIKSFGYPIVHHGQITRIVDEIYEQRDSKHYVDEVKVEFGSRIGYRRTIKPSKTL